MFQRLRGFLHFIPSVKSPAGVQKPIDEMMAAILAKIGRKGDSNSS